VLVRHELLAVLAPGAEVTGAPVRVVDLVPHGLIGTPSGTAMRTLLEEQLEAVGAPTDVAVETAHVASVVPLVLAGAGVAVLPRGMALEAARQGASIAPLDPPAHATVSLVWRPDRTSQLGEQLVLLAGELYAGESGDAGDPGDTAVAPDALP
jgi:DNA-binding transcriptional LysR family regulator